MALTLCGCDTMMKGLVGPSKKEVDAAKAQTPPPTPNPPLAVFVTDSMLRPGYAGNTILPPTLSTTSEDTGAEEPLPPSSAGPHPVLATVPLSSDSKTLAPLGAAANRAANGADAYFVLLVLSPPAADASAMDKGNASARDAAGHAVKALGDAGIAANHVEISMATNPNVGNGEIRLYRR
jgi:hypothetical protein